MIDGDILSRIADKLFSVSGAAWVAAMAFIAHLFRVRNERLRDIATEKAGDWERIRQERDDAREERDMVRDRWAQCEAEKTLLMGENARLEGILQGFGEWRQFQAVRDAGRRLDEHPSGNGGGEP